MSALVDAAVVLQQSVLSSNNKASGSGHGATRARPRMLPERVSELIPRPIVRGQRVRLAALLPLPRCNVRRQASLETGSAMAQLPLGPEHPPDPVQCPTGEGQAETVPMVPRNYRVSLKLVLL